MEVHFGVGLGLEVEVDLGIEVGELEIGVELGVELNVQTKVEKEVVSELERAALSPRCSKEPRAKIKSCSRRKRALGWQLYWRRPNTEKLCI